MKKPRFYITAIDAIPTGPNNYVRIVSAKDECNFILDTLPYTGFRQQDRLLRSALRNFTGWFVNKQKTIFQKITYNVNSTSYISLRHVNAIGIEHVAIMASQILKKYFDMGDGWMYIAHAYDNYFVVVGGYESGIVSYKTILKDDITAELQLCNDKVRSISDTMVITFYVILDDMHVELVEYYMHSNDYLHVKLRDCARILQIPEASWHTMISMYMLKQQAMRKIIRYKDTKSKIIYPIIMMLKKYWYYFFSFQVISLSCVVFFHIYFWQQQIYLQDLIQQDNAMLYKKQDYQKSRLTQNGLSENENIEQVVEFLSQQKDMLSILSHIIADYADNIESMQLENTQLLHVHFVNITQKAKETLFNTLKTCGYQYIAVGDHITYMLSCVNIYNLPKITNGKQIIYPIVHRTFSDNSHVHNNNKI